MSFQVVELELDTHGNVLERKVVPYPYQSRQEAAASAESIASSYAGVRYDPENNYWCAVGSEGHPLLFKVEETP